MERNKFMDGHGTNAIHGQCAISIDRRMTAGETWDSCLDEIRQLPSVQKYGDDVKVSMYMYDRPSWTGEVYETECYFPTWCPGVITSRLFCSIIL